MEVPLSSPKNRFLCKQVYTLRPKSSHLRRVGDLCIGIYAY